MRENTPESPVRGACLCGAIRYEITLPTLGAVHCHCTMCRRWNGAGYTTWFAIQKDHLRIVAGNDHLQRYQSSDHAGRLFCSACGSSLFGDSSRTPDVMYIVRGPVPGEIDAAPAGHQCIESLVPWIEIGDELPRRQGAGVLTTPQDSTPMSDKQTQSAPASSEHVSRAAGLYTHINDLLDAQGQIQGFIHYHLGFQHATEALADKLEGIGVDSSWRLLDLCCGWGVPTRYVAGRFGCRITGIDITQRSIDFARKVTEGTDVEPLVTFRQGSALELPVEAGEFDLVWSQDGFCHVPHRPRLLAECFRVLRPGGHLVFTDWLRGEFITPEELRAFCEAWSFPGVETLDSYPSLLATAGFEIVSQEEVGCEYAVAGDSESIRRGLPSFIQRVGAGETDDAAKFVEVHGRKAYLERLEREKMDIHFAQRKMALGRFVCVKPA
jgi:ubiquinone/menaquinone biosynthesis C-methylase UbiE